MAEVLLLLTTTAWAGVSVPHAHLRAPTLLRASPPPRSRPSASAGEVSFGGLFRGDERGDSQDPTCAVILQHDLARLTLPGQSQQLHLYDSSNLSALRSAFSRKTFVHVALDPEATAKRMFGVIGEAGCVLSFLGARLRAVTRQPSH